MHSLDTIKERLQERPAELARARQNGMKVVGYFCTNVPEEILHALGLIPIRLGRGGDEFLVEIGGRYVSKNNCVYVRQCVGMFAERKDPYMNNCDLVAFGANCMQIYRMAELVNFFFKVPVLVLGVPRNFYLPEGKDYFRKEVENFAEQLERFAGRKLTVNALEESIKLYREIRRTLVDIYQFQAGDNAPISWKDVFSVIQAGFYLDRAEYLSLLESLKSELSIQAGIGGGGSDTRKPRILLSGSIIAPGDNKLIDLIDVMGGRIVADDLCTGLRPLTGVEVKEVSLVSIADAYLGRVPDAALPYLDSLETDRRLANLAHLIDAYRVEGIIYHTLRFCDPFSFKASETKRFFKDKAAFMEIHTEYAPVDIESVRTRVEAFMESIANRRLQKTSRPADRNS